MLLGGWRPAIWLDDNLHRVRYAVQYNNFFLIQMFNNGTVELTSDVLFCLIF
jgi:hypothetical protein